MSMSEIDGRPDPDQLLNAIKTKDLEKEKGKLFIFLGMAAGVGKTYSMLEKAHEALRDGIDVVIGTIDTHGREETQALVKGLPMIPRRTHRYKGTTLSDMDLDAILKRKPQLVLVDELAHSNIPDSYHPKRWQDVLDILEAGIDVYTTLNIQHIESRKDTVEKITGIAIRETVPDSIIEKAVQVELIDLAPTDLLKRLREGKVYLGERAEHAIQNFFQEDKLTALREISLRLTAEKVDFELQNLILNRGAESLWKASDRLLVVITASSQAEKMVRIGKQLSLKFEAKWIAAHVDTGAFLTDFERQVLSKNLSLARELGAEVITTSEPDFVEAIQRIAKKKQITQIVLSRPRKNTWSQLFESNLLKKLSEEQSDIDIYLVRQDHLGKRERPKKNLDYFKYYLQSGILSYLSAIFFIIFVTVACFYLNHKIGLIGYRTVGYIFMLSVTCVSLFASLGPILVSAFLSAFLWNYFFIPPIGSSTIDFTEDLILILCYLLVALVTGTLTRKVTRHERLLRQKEDNTETLYDVVRSITESPNRDICIEYVEKRLGQIFNGDVAVTIKDASDGSLPHFKKGKHWKFNRPKEWNVAIWCFDHNRAAGWSTDTLADAESLYIPMKGASEVVGVLAFHHKNWEKVKSFDGDQENLFHSIVRQMSIFLEREYYFERSLQTNSLRESEKMHQTLLNLISHEMRTPLTTVIGAVSALADEKVISHKEFREKMIKDAIQSAERLNGVVRNLLDMTRLKSGILTLQRDWNDLGDVILSCIRDSHRELSRHKVQVKSEENLPLIRIDQGLFSQAISNILINAAKYSESGKNILVDVRKNKDSTEVLIDICDEGKGIPHESRPFVFDMFYRAPGSKTGGVGLGLSIAKSIVEAHQGRIELKDSKENEGACFSIILPIEEQPFMP